MKLARVLTTALLTFSATAVFSQSGADFMFPAAATRFDEPLASRMAAISAPAIDAHIRFLASPALEGRGLSTRGLDVAIEYAAAALRLAEIQPFGDDSGSYFQQVPLRRITGVAGGIDLKRRKGDLASVVGLQHGRDCLLPQLPPQTISAAVVFGGYGIRESKPARDDYAGFDVKGRMVLVLDGVPPGKEWQARELVDRYASADPDDRFDEKAAIAKKAGAVALLVVDDHLTPDSSAAPVGDEFLAEDPSTHPLPLIRVAPSVAAAILGNDALARARKGSRVAVPPETSMSIRIESKEERFESRNVIGIIRGADPKISNEALIIGAHLDHLGIRGGAIFPGAADNASGVAAVLEIAKAFASSEKPKRTVIFTFWTGEEEGHFGSAWFVKHPRWPLAKTAAYVNLDTVGHAWRPDELRKLFESAKLSDVEKVMRGLKPETFVEVGIPRGNSSLERAVRLAAAANGLPLHLDWTDGTHGQSDYRDFARAGVPFLRFFGDFYPEYHAPTDTPDSLDPAQTQRVARFVLATAWQLATR